MRKKAWIFLGMGLLGVSLAVGSVNAADAKCEDCCGTVKGVVKDKHVAGHPTIVYVSDDLPALASKPPAEPVRMDQKDKTFVPHVLPLVKGGSVEFYNSDPFDHNVYSPEGGFDLGMFGQGKSAVRKFKKAGAYTILCRPHPEMLAFVVVLNNKYYTTTADDGTFALCVPPGTYHLKVWNERIKSKYLKKAYDVTVKKGATSTVEIEPAAKK